jgi:adenosylhomocysteine nucleosidase
MSTAVLIDRFHPARVIFTGIAGSLDPNLRLGDVVVGKSTTQHDYGIIEKDSFKQTATYGFARKRNPLFIEGDPNLIALAQKATQKVSLELCSADSNRPARVKIGIIVTGDVFIASNVKKRQLHNDFQADAVEKEGAAVAQVCYQQNTPCLIIRGLSDNADESAHKTMQTRFNLAADNAARVAIEMIQAWSDANSVRARQRKNSP